MTNKTFASIETMTADIINNFSINPAERNTVVDLLKGLEAGKTIQLLDVQCTPIYVTMQAADDDILYLVSSIKGIVEYWIKPMAELPKGRNVIHNSTFVGAADMIEAVFGVEDWRINEGHVETALRNGAVGLAVSVLANDLQNITIIRRSSTPVVIEATFNGSTLFFIIGEDESKEAAKPNTPFGNIVKNFRSKLFLKKLADAQTPMEAFDLATEWLAEDQEYEGKFGYKDMAVMYSFEFNKLAGTIRAELTVGNKVKCEGCGEVHEMEPIFQIKSNLNPRNIDMFYNSVKSFAENFLK